MQFLKLLVFSIGLAAISYSLHGQDIPQPSRRGSRVIDDTTKQVYGPNTSRYFYEQDVFFNRQVYYPIDTVIRNFHRYTYVQRHENFYQDLGNIGTAIRPIFYRVPEVIGVRSGFNVYDMYWDTEAIRYYDTKSPYSNMKVVLGGRGRSITRATFSRNITPLWNFGFTYRGLFIDKQIQRRGKGDRNVRSQYYDFFTTYQSKDSSYRAFFNFRRQNHLVFEYGGIFQPDDFEYADYFDLNAQPVLSDARSQELRMETHFFHQYEVGRALQFYHVFDRSRKGSDFISLYERERNKDYYKTYTRLEGDTTQDNTKFKYVRNEVGIKGNLLKLFYNGYYAIRDYKMHYKFIPNGVFAGTPLADTLRVNTNGVENYLGGRIALNLDSLLQITGWAEVMDQGNYRIEGGIRSKWLEARLRQMQYAPAYMQQAYRGAHHKWNNAFNNTTVSQLQGYAHLKNSVLSVSPGVTFTRLNNYIFFKQDTALVGQEVFPVQSSGQQIIAAPELRLSLTFFRHIRLSTQILHTRLLENADDALQVPQLFVNGQLAYENIFFGGNLDLHAGVDLHWRSAYRALGYDVAIRQFHVQNTTTVQAFPLVDIFVNAKIKRGRVFFKYSNLLQAITKQGYIITPEYPGMRNVLDFGFDWSFYD